mmetsp:Transcript_108533/g.248758  ORF Transcript_108533/g.248758 Transcript_108533/m.248758 type:complete len:234 (-) Transcript_108533:449-1150(-)
MCRVLCMSSAGSKRLSLTPISSKAASMDTKSSSAVAYTNLAKARRFCSPKALASPQSSSTGRGSASARPPSTSRACTRMLPGWGSPLKRPSTCIWYAKASQMAAISRSRSRCGSRSSRSRSVTFHPAQKLITTTFRDTMSGTSRGISTFCPLRCIAACTRCRFSASKRKSSSRRTPRVHSSMITLKSNSGSKNATTVTISRMLRMSSSMRNWTSGCCTFTTTSCPSGSVARCT